MVVAAADDDADADDDDALSFPAADPCCWFGCCTCCRKFLFCMDAVAMMDF